MEDGTTIEREVSNDHTVEIAADEASSKISQLKERITDLENENGTIIRENKEYKQKIEELKSSVRDLSAENVDLKKQVNKVQSENKASQVVVARAANLETEVSRLQHDLAAAMSDLKESSEELSDLKRDLVGMKVREKEKDVKLGAVEMEKALLVAKVEKLAGGESSLRDELQVKEKEIRGLKKNVEELEVVVGSSKNSEKLKNELEKTIEKMKAEISVLEHSLDEKEKVISGQEWVGNSQSIGFTERPSPLLDADLECGGNLGRERPSLSHTTAAIHRTDLPPLSVYCGFSTLPPRLSTLSHGRPQLDPVSLDRNICLEHSGKSVYAVFCQDFKQLPLVERREAAGFPEGCRRIREACRAGNPFRPLEEGLHGALKATHVLRPGHAKVGLIGKPETIGEDVPHFSLRQDQVFEPFSFGSLRSLSVCIDLLESNWQPAVFSSKGNLFEQQN
ncbi:uncharacterized protein LOC105177059 [Sesamum indicum]|uniref:Uncharacterized protein LOC105177059 n=1 Tax=Sesamum indicum TaxID=4182 RepID=A0A8M8VD76_SESIN|nr:uncharacterized protein LOC105177059 [Sesamum indicum]